MNPLSLVIIIPRIRYMVPTMYTAGFEPARGGEVHFRNEKSFRTRGPQNRFGMKIIAAVSSLPAIHS